MTTRGIGLAATCAWLATAAMAHDAAPAAHGAPRLVVLTQGSTTLDPAQQRQLAALPATELRQRVDQVLAAHPDDLVAHLLRAQADSDLGDFAATLADLDPVLPALAPGAKAFAFAMRSEALMQLGRNDEALADGERAVADDANDTQAHLARGWALHLARQDDTRALRDIEAGVAADPGDAVALSRRGILHLALDQPEAALADLKKSVELGPDDARLRINLAGALLSMGQVEAGRLQIEATLRLAPDLATAWTMRAQLELSQGQFDAAIAAATHALALRADRNDQADAYLGRAMAWGAKGDYDKMLADADKGAEIDPSRVDFPRLRGIRETDLGQWAQANATLTHALALAPDCAVCLADRAIARAQLGEREAALADAKAAIELAPGDPSTHLLSGNAFATLGDLRAALRQFDAALDIDPTIDAARIQRGEAKEELGDHAGAISDFTQVVSRGPSPAQGEALAGRANAWFNAGDLASAIADWRRAAALAPQDAEPPRMLGFMLERSGDLPGAAQAYAQALALAPTGPTAASLGRVLMFSGRFTQAREAYATSLNIDKSPSPYTVLWIYLARIRADVGTEAAAQAELATRAAPHEPRIWTDALAEFMLGRIDANALLRRADESAADQRAGARCEADYYIAEIELAHGRRDAARPLLAEAVRLCPASFHEASGAKAEQALQAKGTASN